jgi:plastocyanin
MADIPIIKSGKEILGANLKHIKLMKIYDGFRNSSELKKAVTISIILGMLLSVMLILESKEESFSSLYIYPDSYTNYPDGDTTSFMYGFKSNEKERIAYHLEIFMGDILVDKKDFDLDPLEVHEEEIVLKIPEVRFPVKVRLVVKSKRNTYDTHYWLKKPEEEKTAPIKTPQITMPTPGMTPYPQSTYSMPIPGITPDPQSTYRPILTPSPPLPTQTGNVTAIMINRIFDPNSVNIKSGGKVIWVNRDTFDRKITLINNEGLFTQEINIDRRFEYIFKTPGIYTFTIKEVPGVEGIVTVS